ncbi:uncharacterized protein A4U43_UnF9430 [Asparagus officinalis]|uniref:MINDY deubiquitinase domain-containing protein n=1 Tax=Asparagus officinalis TaxID=4686 RepID=A0A1R3L5Q6_ASPOF|nr:uncharacterized protein A4U43_UnF9430 [Asparagus officinalis]
MSTTTKEDERVSASNEAETAGGEGQERQQQQQQEEKKREAVEEEEAVYKTKVIQFLGRSTPIVLQNDNGPCPLLAICNVLLLRNSLNLGLDASEVPLQKLLSLVAEKLIDSNSNVQDKEDAYVINQQQNIADAIDLLPRLATGIDVNVQFRKINDFEFTRECAIFDLFDIGLYHGWIVDPQDTDTASAIGSKSYNTLMGELVAFDAIKSTGEDKNVLEDDSVDFAAATTAALGVPSPCLSREGSGHIESSGAGTHVHPLVARTGVGSEESQQLDLFALKQSSSVITFKDFGLNSNVSSTVNALSSNMNAVDKMDQTVSNDSEEVVVSGDPMENIRADILIPNQDPSFQPVDNECSDGCNTYKRLSIASKEDTAVTETFTEDLLSLQMPNKNTDNPVDCDSVVFPVRAITCAE